MERADKEFTLRVVRLFKTLDPFSPLLIIELGALDCGYEGGGIHASWICLA
jgi:hypothetical protein